MRVKALQYMYYNKKEYQAGDEYDMDDREETTAKLLVTLGKIQIVGKQIAKAQPVQTYRTAEVKAEEEEEKKKPVEPMTLQGNEALAGPERRQYYRRRDMKAEK